MTKDYSKYLDQTHYADIEAVGFWEVVNGVDDIHCLCSITEDDEVVLWHNKPELDNAVVWDDVDEKEYIIPERAGTLMEGFRYWFKIGQKGGKLSIHNLWTYDKPIIEKVVPKCILPDECYIDSFIQSKIQWFDRPCPRGARSAHGLQAYGIKFGVKKPPITDFTKFDAYILHRVVEDCRIQKKTQLYLNEEARKLAQLGIDFKEAYKIECEYAKNVHQQELNGAKVDKPHMERCIKEWDITTNTLEEKIEPLLPPTVKVNSTRVSRSELMKALGYDKSKIPPDDMEEVKRAGETKTQAVKPYYKPSVNFHKAEKINTYSGFNISYGESPTFTKKKMLTDWIKENHPDTKPKEWDIDKELKETKILNANACKYFEVEPTGTDLICGAHTRVGFTTTKLTQHEKVKSYLIKYAGLKSVVEWNLKKGDEGIIKADCFTIVSYPPKNAPEHQLHYKVKKGEALVTSPKLQEQDYTQLTGDIGKKIGEYNTTCHRRRYLSNPKDPENKGVMSYIREDGRVPAGVNNFGTATGRGSQRIIVNLPSESAPLGKEMRQIIIPEEGNVLVGADMASAQLQICAFVTNNVVYYEAVAKGKELAKCPETGKDIYLGSSAHCFNARAFNIISEYDWKECISSQDPALMHKLSLQRKEAKAPAFASLFGCGAPKLAGMLNISVPEAKDKLENFLIEMGLDGVIAWLKVCSKKYKRGSGFYIPSAFGYWIYCKSLHSAVNYLIQSIEGAVQKIAVNYFHRNNTNPKVMKVLDTHDEYLVECPAELGEEVGVIMGESYTYAGKMLSDWYKANIELYSGGNKVLISPDFNGGFAVGQSYYECH